MSELGYDIPALPGMALDQVQTPCLTLDLDALEANIRQMGHRARSLGVAHRAHAKMHKSVDVARLQISLGGAVGLCCQKVSEAEVFARAGIADLLVSNQVRDPARIDRLARLPLLGATVAVCVDDPANVAELSAAALRHGTTIGALVEVDCGQGRCGVTTPAEAVGIAQAIAAAPGLRFGGVQAYQGAMQHLRSHSERQTAFTRAEAVTRAAVQALTRAGLPPPVVTGGGTGSWQMEAQSGLWTEVQSGSYAFMDADYAQVLDAAGQRLDGIWRPALQVLAQVISTRPGQAVCDAGLKAMSGESGLPTLPGFTCTGLSDEHAQIADPQGRLRVGDRLSLTPGHCDPTCNLHDWYVVLRAGVVQAVWPVSARGKLW